MLSILSEEIGERSVYAVQTAGGSEGRSCTGASAAKREVRVVARGRSSSQATIRSILIAAAMATCCKCVFSKPRSLLLDSRVVECEDVLY